MFSFSKRPDPAWREPPRGEKRPLDRMMIEAQATHDISGASLYILRNETDNGLLVCWTAPWQRSIREYHSPATMREARAMFKAMTEWGPPQTPSLCRDWQRDRLYAWESEAIDKASPRLPPAQMENVIRRISRDFNLAAAPTMDYAPPDADKGAYSFYLPSQEHIHMGHDELSAVIHEMAHAIDEKINGNNWAAHGPSYVRTLLMLAARYQYWLEPEALERSAKAAGLAIAPDTMPCRKPGGLRPA